MCFFDSIFIVNFVFFVLFAPSIVSLNDTPQEIPGNEVCISVELVVTSNRPTYKCNPEADDACDDNNETEW